METSTGPYGIALLILLLLGLHTVSIGLPYLLHYYDNVARANERRPSVNGYLRAFIVEWFFGFAVHASYVLGVFGGGVSGRFDPQGGPPIVLCHGFCMNRTNFFALYWRLRRAGYRNLYAINLRPLIAPLEEQAQTLGRMIRMVSAAAGGEPVTGIGHSQGGLLLRMLATPESDVPLARIITLGTPHRGTRMAYLGLGPNARQLRPGSSLLESLPAEPTVPLTAFYSDLDQIVNPAESARLGRDSRFFAEAGHFALLYRDDVARALQAELPPVRPTEQPAVSSL